MKKIHLVALAIAVLSLAPGCFRQEILVAEYSIPEMTTPAAGTYIQNRLKGMPGIVGSSFDIEARTFTVDYRSSVIRTMNIEDAIATAGFAVNDRPANPKAKLPKGLQ